MACGPAPSSRGLGRDGGQQHRGRPVPGGRARPALQRRRRATAGRGPRPARRPEPVVGGEETGRAAACVPYLTSAVIATTALLGTGDDLLAGLAAGRLTAALAIDFAAMP